jgi:hypothetical protein
MIYAIEAVGSGFIKFGRAKSVGKRLKELETACPYELNILAVVDWPDSAESAVHCYLAPESQRAEWFRDSPIVREMLTWMADGPKGLERLQAAVANRRSSWHTPISTAVEKRLAQRKAYWKAKECETLQ